MFRKVDEITNLDQATSDQGSYVFIVVDPSKIGDFISIVENNNSFTTVATSPLDADLRFHKNYNSS